MADEDQGQKVSDLESGDRSLSSFIHSPDWFLQNVVEWANRAGVEMGIIVTAGGLIISGTLTSGKKYFEWFGATFAAHFKEQETVEAIKTLHATYASIYDEEESEMPEKPTYIHIKNVRFFGTDGTSIPQSDGAWWRGRLEQVDGFSLGSMRQQ